MKIRSIEDGRVIRPKLYPYQQATINILENFDRNIVIYGRQMGLTHVLCKYALDKLKNKKSVLILTAKSVMSKEITQRIKLNVFDPDWSSNSRIVRNGKTREHVKIETCDGFTKKYNIDTDDINQYDTIIVDLAQFVSDKVLKKLLDILDNDDFKGKLVLASSGVSSFKGTFYRLYTEDDNYNTITARRFIHPTFSKEWYDSTVSMLGKDFYRREYECRFE